MNNDKHILEMKDFDDMAEKGIKRIVMSKHKYKEFANALYAKNSERYTGECLLDPDLPPVKPSVKIIHTDFGNIDIKTEEDYLSLSVGQRVPFDTPYGIGDLVQYKHSGDGDSEKTHYSKVIKILPQINADNFSLEFRFVMENGRLVPFKDILSLEKKGPPLES